MGDNVSKDNTNVTVDFPIDAVITWVDGADPKHAEKLNTYLSSIKGGKPKSASKTRFHHAGEIDYCVTSLLKFAPWIRTIFIVTDEQSPALMQTIKGSAYEERIKIVDHKTIFAGYEQHLPTFNSSSILTMLWRIPNLAEHFVFLNDDFVLVNPVYPGDFFRDYSVVLRGKWHSLQGNYLVNQVKKLAKYIATKGDVSKVRPGHRERQKMAAALAGFTKRYFRLPHNPHAWRVSTQQSFYAVHPDVLEENIRYRLRSPKQFVVEAFAAHLELKNGSALIDNSRNNIQLKPAEQFYWRINYKLMQADRNKNAIFCCIQSIESASPKKQKLIFAWLDKRVGRLEDLLKHH